MAGHPSPLTGRTPAPVYLESPGSASRDLEGGPVGLGGSDVIGFSAWSSPDSPGSGSCAGLTLRLPGGTRSPWSIVPWGRLEVGLIHGSASPPRRHVGWPAHDARLLGPALSGSGLSTGIPALTPAPPTMSGIPGGQRLRHHGRSSAALPGGSDPPGSESPPCRGSMGRTTTILSLPAAPASDRNPRGRSSDTNRNRCELEPPAPMPLLIFFCGGHGAVELCLAHAI